MEIEKLFISLALDASKYVKGLRSSQKEGASWAKRMKQSIGGGLQKAALIGGAAVLALGVTIAGVAVQGVTAFIGFENSMNEVFTLLPNISQDAMDDMSGQVLVFSKDFAVLPDEVVPALYQSLSAGVPPDNVFAFLETAQKAAIGGVTDLETAVDGITSVVNAYGEEVVGAAKASDIMFTAVRLGKTDFSQLSSSLFNVIPTAASLRISFEEVAAGLATLTAQGTPTSVATTQIRSLFVELSKTGGDLATVIEQELGASFSTLVGEGMSVTGILDTVRSSMSDDEFRNMFGSVEALNAALGTTGPNADSMMSSLDAMMDSAGATDAAYTQMNTGIQRSIDKFKAFAGVALIQVGDALSPVIDKLVELGELALPVIESAMETVIGFMDTFFGNLEAGMNPLDAFIAAIDGLIPQEIIDVLLNFRDNILPGVITSLESLWESVQPVIETIKAAVLEFVGWQDIMIAVGLVIGAVLIAAIANIIIAIAPVIIAIVAIIAIVSLLRNAWENDWGGIQEKTSTVVTVITTVIQTIRDFIVNTLIPTVVNLFETWSSKWNTMQTILENVWVIVSAIFTEIGRWINDNIMPWVVALKETWILGFNAIRDVVAEMWAIVKPVFDKVKNFLAEKLAPAVTELNIVWGNAMGAMSTAVKPVQTAIESIKTAASNFLDFLKSSVFEFDFKIPDLPDWALPGSPLPIHTAWKAFAGDIDGITIAPKMDLSSASLAGAGVVNNSGGVSYRSETTVNLPEGADPLRAIRASRHLDKLGRRAGQ